MVAPVLSDLPWQIHLSDAEVWQREQVVVEVSVKASDPFALLKTDKLVIPGMQVKALPLINDEKTHLLTLRWQLYPHSSGKQQIKLPPIRYYLYGGTRAKWQPPVQTIEVRALPPYMPPTLPVGRVSIQSTIEPEGVLKPDSLAYWHITLHSKTVPSGQFPAILKQLRSTKGLDVLPAKVTVNPNQGDAGFQLDYVIPVKAKRSGKLNLPKLQWHWFNPENARLERVSYQAPRPWVLALWEKILLLLGGILVSVLGLFYLFKKGFQRLKRWKSKRKVCNILQQNADDYDLAEIQKSLIECAKTHQWPTKFSVRQWLSFWQNQYGENLRLEHYLNHYEEKKFSK